MHLLRYTGVQYIRRCGIRPGRGEGVYTGLCITTQDMAHGTVKADARSVWCRVVSGVRTPLHRIWWGGNYGAVRIV